jgi:hypothetical protein
LGHSLPAPGVANVRVPRGRFASDRRLGVARRSTSLVPSKLLECLLPFLDIVIHLRHYRNIIASLTVRMLEKPPMSLLELRGLRYYSPHNKRAGIALTNLDTLIEVDYSVD